MAKSTAKRSSEASSEPSDGRPEKQVEPAKPGHQAAPSPMVALLQRCQAGANEDDLKASIAEVITGVLNRFSISAKYNCLVLWDETQLVRSDADSIYKSITRFPQRRDILLCLYSRGGSIGAGYLIAKLCKEYSDSRFVVTVPRSAKSAATLICCGADELHMGSLSELGPIDPQIDRLPALGLKQAVEHLADLAARYPAASEMFAAYLSKTLALDKLGYYERVAESAVQYAERLLSKSAMNLPTSANSIAHHLVYDYKDHGFVIDTAECGEIFGASNIKQATPEYQIGNELYEALDVVKMVLDGLADRHFWFAGSAEHGASINKKQSD